MNGGLFLLWKSTTEIHQTLEGTAHDNGSSVKAAFWPIIAQITVIDLAFSLDSIITAVGMVEELGVMITAVIASVALMMVFAKSISHLSLNTPQSRCWH